MTNRPSFNPFDYDLERGYLEDTIPSDFKDYLESVIPTDIIVDEREILVSGVGKVKRRPKIPGQDNETESIVQHSETEISTEKDNGEDNSTGDGAHGRNTGWRQKVDLEWIFIITNFVLELPSAVFDQLSSVYKPQYALVGMLISFAATLTCIAELNYKRRKETVTWRWRVALPWLYYQSESHKPLGSFEDIFGLACALCQSIVTTINYVFCLQHADNPIKISVWPIIFAFGLLCSKLLGNPGRRRAVA